MGRRAQAGGMWGALAALALVSSQARADGPLGPPGSPIETSQYALDLHRGPVLSSSRVTGLGGAFTAIAEGTEGGLVNPAAVAARPPQSADFWDYWYSLGLTYPFETEDFFHSGGVIERSDEDAETSFFYFNPGGYLQLWDVGFGLNVDIQVASLENARGALAYQNLLNHVQLGYQFFRGELTVGGGLQIARSRIVLDPADAPKRVAYVGVGFGGEVGVLYRPRGERFRLGGSLFTAVSTKTKRSAEALEQADGDVVVGPFTLPERSVHPWRGALGFAYQLGPRPTNTPIRWVRQVAADGLADIERRMQAVRDARDADLAALRRSGAGRRDPRIEAREQAAEQKLAALKEERAALKRETWRMLREQVRRGWPREYLLFTVDLQISGRVVDAVGVESFFARTVQRSGQRITVTPHFGIEGEAVPEWLKLRMGSYIEPSRFRGVKPRGHWTLGFDLRVLHWDVFGIWPEDYLWQLSSALDAARGYQAFSVSIGGWY